MTKEESNRIEAISLAIKSFDGPVPSDDIVISRAKKFEEYIKNGETNE